MSLLAAYAVPHPPLIIPAIGRGEERGIQDTIDAYQDVAARIAQLHPQTVIVTSPHAPLYRDGFFVSDASRIQGDMARFRAPQEIVDVAGDPKLAARIMAIAQASYGIPTVGPQRNRDMLGEDHATFIPLWFMRDQLPSLKVVRIGLSGLSGEKHRQLGHAIAQAINDLDRRAVFVASGDLSHKLLASGPYGFSADGPVFDEAIDEIFTNGHLPELFDLDPRMCQSAAECGLRSFWIMTGALDGLDYTAELMAHEGPFGVGYAVAAFECQDNAEAGK